MKQSEEYRSRHSMEVPGKSKEVPGKSTEAPDNCQELPWSRKKSLYGCHENAAWQQLTDRQLRRMAIAYQLGTSEQFVGRALRDMARRDDVVVATKFLPRTEEEIQQGIDGRRHVLNNINSSLEHLGMDYVDLYIYHIWDYKYVDAETAGTY